MWGNMTQDVLDGNLLTVIIIFVAIFWLLTRGDGERRGRGGDNDESHWDSGGSGGE